MKLFKTNISFLFSLALFTSPAQQHSWPPEAPGLAPITLTMTLPGDRKLPSSERWNLIWADQLVPNWISDSQMVFAANHYIGTQKIFKAQASQFRTVNPNFLVVAYHLASGLNPAMNSDCPDPKDNTGTDFIGVIAPKGYISEYTEYFQPWLAAKNISESSPAFEAIFQHFDEMRKDKRVWHRDPYWLMNMDNGNWRDYLSETCLNWMKGNEDEGVFFDVAVETSASLYNPNTFNPAPGNFNWWENPHAPFGYPDSITTRQQFAGYMNSMYLPYFQEVYRSFHLGDTSYLVLPNVDQMITTVYDPTWLGGDANGETVDGAMIESFGHANGGDMYLTLERVVRHITGRGKILIAQSYPSSSSENARLIGMFMLVKNENSYVNILSSSGVEWYPEYEIDLGKQTPIPSDLNALRVQGSGSSSLWRREYERGAVLCNTSSASMMYTLSGDGWSILIPSGGGDVGTDGTMQAQSIEMIPVSSSVSVAASDCVILLRDVATGLGRPNALPAEKHTIFPQPALGYATVLVADGKRNHTVRLFSISGVELPIVFTEQSGKIYLDTRSYPPGTYTVLVRSDGTVFHARLIIAP